MGSFTYPKKSHNRPAARQLDWLVMTPIECDEQGAGKAKLQKWLGRLQAACGALVCCCRHLSRESFDHRLCTRRPRISYRQLLLLNPLPYSIRSRCEPKTMQLEVPREG